MALVDASNNNLYSHRCVQMPRMPSARQLLLLLCVGLSLLLLLSTTIHAGGAFNLSTGSTAAQEEAATMTKDGVQTDALQGTRPSRNTTIRTITTTTTTTTTITAARNSVKGVQQPQLPAPDTYQPDGEGVCTGSRWPAGVVPLYIITPTYPRAEQIPELTRTGQTLLHIDALVWIVAEDAAAPTPAVTEYLKSSGLCYVYLRAQMPRKYKKLRTKPRGVANRNAGLKWIRKNSKKGGVLYFADDDNTYDRRIFEEIRGTRKVSMFPVGLVTKLGVSSPIVRQGKVTGYYDGWISDRKFPVDMAGFAVNINLFLNHTDAVMPYVAGREETKFLEKLSISNLDIEPLASDCKKILVWHTRTVKNAPARSQPKELNITRSNIEVLSKQLWRGKR